MPCRAMRLDLSRISSCPSYLIEPLRLASMPMMARMVVVLPAPLRPSSVTTSPALTSKFMPCRTWLSPYQPCTSRTASCASAMSRPHVGFHHLRVLGHFRVGALRQHLAARQHGVAFEQFGDHREVVLHHQHRAVLGDALDEGGGALDVLRA